MNKFCMQCGTQVAETARFCNKCGTPLQPTQPAQTQPPINYQQPNYQAPPYQQPGQFGQGNLPYQVPASGGDLKPNVAGMLCYPLSIITGILFLVLAPYNKDRFVRFHAYQAIFFFVAMMVLSFGLGILGIVLPWRVERALSNLHSLLWFAGTVWSMFQAYRGETFKLPFIGDLAENQANK